MSLTLWQHGRLAKHGYGSDQEFDAFLIFVFRDNPCCLHHKGDPLFQAMHLRSQADDSLKILIS